MIKSLYGKNFQIHREFQIDLDPGLNVITGTSDEGKSAVLRLIKWVSTDRPLGDEFKNWDAPKKESVCGQIELDDGSCVSLERQNDRNVYTVFDKDGIAIKFNAIKTDVPSEVSTMLNLADYNTQSQHSTYYLLQDTPGDRAKKLNDLVGLSVVDKIFSGINSEVRKISARISLLTSDRDTAKENLLKYEKLDDIEIVVERLEKAQAETSATVSSLNQINQKLSLLTKIKEERERLQPLLEIEPIVISILAKIEEVKELEYKIQKINKIVTATKSIKKELEIEKIWLSLESVYNDLTERIKEVSDISDKIIKINTLIAMDKRLSKSMEEENSNKKTKIGEYMKIIKESNVCPTCLNSLSPKYLKHLEESLYG